MNINYFNIIKKKLCGRNNNTTAPLCFDYDCVVDLTFAQLDNNNKIVPLDPNASGLYLAGGMIGLNGTFGECIFLSKSFVINEDGSVTFSVNTYTQQYLDSVKKKYTEINLELGIYTGEQGEKQILLRDTALACPRVYIEGVEPEDITGDYYTKEELNEIVNNLSGFVIRETEATAELMHLTPVETLSGASGMIDKGKVYYLDMKEDFTLSVKLPEGLQLKEIPSGAADTYNMGTRTITRNVGEYTFTGDKTWSLYGFNATLQKYSYGFGLWPDMKSGAGQAGTCDRFEIWRGNWGADTCPNNVVRFGQQNAIFYYFTDDNLTLEQLQERTAGMTITYPIANHWQEQLGGPWLRTVRDVSDTWDPATGIITRRIGVHKFTGTESISNWSGVVPAGEPSCAGYFSKTIIYPLGERGQAKVLMSTPGLEFKQYDEIYAGQAGYCGNAATGMAEILGPFIRVNADDFSASSEIVPWLARNGVEMWYILKEPREEHFTVIPQAISIGDPRPYAPEDYGEAVLFVKPNEYAFTAENMLLDADMGNFSTYRMLISWTPVGVLCEQTGAWTD